ncbi:hypothetical protein [Campylobacter sp.]|uniref:hypothetical protein n=1 Tax=Campylobacter sp. TaxID=205 RepID=UPI003FA0A3B0
MQTKSDHLSFKNFPQQANNLAIGEIFFTPEPESIKRDFLGRQILGNIAVFIDKFLGENISERNLQILG